MDDETGTKVQTAHAEGSHIFIFAASYKIVCIYNQINHLSL